MNGLISDDACRWCGYALFNCSPFAGTASACRYCDMFPFLVMPLGDLERSLKLDNASYRIRKHRRRSNE